MNIIEIGLSFLEGLALIVSPCILPVLPLVLGASVNGGRKRPFGIILGFIAAFTAFAMFSRKLVLWFDINLDMIKYSSIILLAVFGLILLSETLSGKFSLWTSRFANAGSRVSSRSGDGFFSGILVGILIGLVWTPCAGPILATALVQIIRQESDLQAVFLLAAFAFGAGLPMLLISLTGRQLMEKLHFFKTHAEGIRKAVGVLILLMVAFIGFGGEALMSAGKDSAMQEDTHASMEYTNMAMSDTSQSMMMPSKEPVARESTLMPTSGLQHALDQVYPAPEFTGIQSWLNSKPLTMAELKGKVILVDFWTYSCVNCVRTLPHVTQWDRAYRDKGLVIVGVHAPEFEFEKDKANVQRAIAKHHIQYPVALDNRLDTWQAFSNRYWPAHYLIDRQGRIVYTHFGEGNYAETENNIRYLLGLNQKKETRPEAPSASRNQSPETYLGYERAKNFSSIEAVNRNMAQSYSPSLSIPLNHWALSGIWRVNAEHITAEKPGATLRYHFTAGKVFLVLGTKDGKPAKASLKLNGKPIGNVAGKDAPEGILTVDQHALYELVDQPEIKNGLLEITALSPGLKAYAFTFGN